MVWIEIYDRNYKTDNLNVTTFAVVWIEIDCKSGVRLSGKVTTIAVVWIEMVIATTKDKVSIGHHLRGGVD